MLPSLLYLKCTSALNGYAIKESFSACFKERHGVEVEAIPVTGVFTRVENDFVALVKGKNAENSLSTLGGHQLSIDQSSFFHHKYLDFNNVLPKSEKMIISTYFWDFHRVCTVESCS